MCLRPAFSYLYDRATAQNGGVARPEARLYSALVGGPLLPLGLWWFSWTQVSSSLSLKTLDASRPLSLALAPNPTLTHLLYFLLFSLSSLHS